MDLDLAELVEGVRCMAPDPLARLRIAARTASELTSVGDSLVSQFVEDCRQAGHGWTEIAPFITETGRTPIDQIVDSRAKGQQRGSGPEPPQVVGDHPGKYRRLWEWLTRQQDSEIQASFSELEGVLGFPLPRSCRDHLPHWYGYRGSAVARAIIDAGWRARNVNVKTETLTLTRSSQRSDSNTA